MEDQDVPNLARSRHTFARAEKISQLMGRACARLVGLISVQPVQQRWHSRRLSCAAVRPSRKALKRWPKAIEGRAA